MKLTDVQDKARRLGINPKKLRKADLIREIQKGEGHQPCFQMYGFECEQEECCWRKECLV